jgi:protocatechuate 3,4-dioxygenase beta subunit
MLLVVPLVGADQGVSEQGKLALSVVDKATEKPIANAQVDIFQSGKGISEEQKRQKLSTDANGACTVVFPVALPDYTKISVEAAGYTPIYATWYDGDNANEPDPIPKSFVFSLDKGTSIGGLVKNPQGEPVEGVEVHLWLGEQQGKVRYSLTNSLSTTDAEGKWRSDIVPKNIDHLRMNLKHPDYMTTKTWNTIPVPPRRELRDFTAVMVLKSGVTLSGVVRDDKGNPIHKAVVQLGSSGHSSKTIQTDEQGCFEFKNCDEGRLHLSVLAEGKSPQARRILPKEIGTPLEFRLEPGNPLRVRVVDPNGSPLADVWATPESYRGYRYILRFDPNNPPSWGKRTDETGLLTWDSAPPDAVEWAFTKEGYARVSKVELVADGKEHTVILHRPVHVVGTVVDKETGEPIPEFTIAPTLDWLTRKVPFINRSRAFQAKDGRYEWKTSRTDTGHYVRIEAKGYLPAMSRMLRVGQDTRTTINFELEKGRNVEGVVYGIDGEPLAGADVLMCTAMQSVYLSNGRLSRVSDTLMAKTNAEGRFSFSPQTDPFLLVVANDQGYAEMTRQEFAASDRIRLERWAKIEGKLVQDGKPVSGHRMEMYPVRVNNSAEPHFFCRYNSSTNEKGEFVFERVAPGPVSLSPDLGRWEPSALTSAQGVPLVAKPGDTITLSLGTEGRSIKGKVVLPPNIKRDMAWDYGINYLVAMRDGIGVPDSLKSHDFDWRGGYDDIWTASRAGRVYFQTLHKHTVKLSPEGDFRVEGVKPGQYQLVLRIYEPPRGMG